MKHPSKSEAARIARVRATGLCDRDVRDAFRSDVAMAKLICRTKLASVSLIEEKTVNFLSHNFPAALDVSELPRHNTLCQHILPSGTVQIVPDLRKDLRFANTIYLNGPPRFVFWAGFPLIDDDGFVLGSLSVADFRPMTLDNRSVELMVGLASQISRRLKSLAESLPDLRPRLATLLHSLSEIRPQLSLHDAETFVRLCSGTAADPQQSETLIATGLACLTSEGTVALTPQGEQIRTDHHLDAPLLRRKGSKVLHQDQIAFYLDQLAAADSAA